MIQFFKNIFKKKEVKRCPHGWEIDNEDLLPIKRTIRGFSVCPDCALNSSLSQFGSGTVLPKEIADKLRESIKNK